MTLSPGEVIERLAPVYGMPVNVPSGDPLAELILTILSQNTADTNSGRAFNAMLRAYGSWAEIAAAPAADLVQVIQPGGLANQKGPRIQRVLQAVAARSPDMSLGFLAELPLEDANTWLRSLPGVGPKTAACVLLFGLGRPALPVDTHVERVSKRLGLVAERRTPEQAHDDLAAAVDPEDYYRFHMLLIKHGRRTCGARRPACERCPLQPDCPAGSRPG
ncbi:MAG: endonuclease III [Dehalococcoidia bacterium]|nr:endonuclease III [Dehalococcoidia bacterium]MCB9486213.1 endonuclease III [Thermoflexaceae bacterium]